MAEQYQTAVRICKKHNQELAIYCFDDRKLCCLEGFTKDHQGHSCKSVSDAAREVRSGMQHQLRTIHEKVLPSLNDKLEVCESNASEENIKAHKRDLLAVEEEFLEEVKSCFASKRSQLEAVEKDIVSTSSLQKGRAENLYKDIRSKAEHMKGIFLLPGDAHLLEMNDELQQAIQEASLFKPDVPVYNVSLSAKTLKPTTVQVLSDMIDNLCATITKRGRSDSAATRIPSKYLVAAIDLGTAYSGYAYSFRHEYEADPLKVCSHTWTAGSRSLSSLKTPTTVLFDSNQNFVAFGYEAEDIYSKLAVNNEHEGHYYFSGFKMTIFGEKILERDQKLKDINGKEMDALRVFSYAISSIMDHMLQKLERQGTGLQKSNIYWVLTVPAIWNDSAKAFMGKAADRAGICHEDLTLCPEPEAALLYCMNIPVEWLLNTAERGLSPYLVDSKCLVLDCGDETAEFTVYEVQADKTLKQLDKASGGAWGSKLVDEQYRQMLITIFGTDTVEKFKTTVSYDYEYMFQEFDMRKRISFETSGIISVKIPISLVEIFKEKTGKNIKKVIANTKFAGKISLNGDKMRMTSDVMRDLFRTAGGRIIEHVKDLLKRCSGIDKIVMVGEFSESPILQQMIRANFENRGIRVIIPPEAGLAVLKGAVIFGHEQIILKSY